MYNLIIIDAHNALYKHPIWSQLLREDINKARLALIEHYFNLARTNKLNYYFLAFDGILDLIAPKINNLEIQFSAQSSADELIKAKIKSSIGKYKIQLISSDVDLHKFARERSCEVSPAESVQKASKNKNQKSEKPNGSGKKIFNELLSAFSEPLANDDWKHF